MVKVNSMNIKIWKPNCGEIQKEYKMKRALKRIQNGQFAEEWIKENKKGQRKFNRLRKAGAEHEIEKVGKRLRGLMPWIKKRSTKGAQASYS